ncbi:uncharacterized protein LOC111710758 [Eurytemora carolleeae]|uniref:uncharacterized protein LOC111710758 n=1 Tax=Eurytemora carolleeae TaxID=1294199 RepID=UPI000C78C2D7|nr:uncharacterized protein LOC111710758 [Eurytemora carolleeae]|eukprot:XP_023340653.1 uncharacterized protein LOC111710758 [Eurytemora affinis]
MDQSSRTEKKKDSGKGWRSARKLSQTELIPELLIEDLVMEKVEEGGGKDEKENDEDEDNSLCRRYSNLLDLPTVNINDSIINIPGNAFHFNQGFESTGEDVFLSRKSVSTPWMDQAELINHQDTRFVKDFKPFFFLCQISGLFPQELSWKLPFSWCYWGTFVSLAHLLILLFLLGFYIVQVGLKLRTGLLFVSYNLAWIVHISHSIDWILVFFHQKKTFKQIWQGYRKFYRYLLADRSDRSCIRFTWKTFIGWEIMFILTAAALLVKSYSDRFFCVEENSHNTTTTTIPFTGSNIKFRQTILATVDQLDIVRNNSTVIIQDVLFWIHLACNLLCLNVVFLSEVFFMMLISVIFHAFSFLHKQINELLGKPDSVFHLQAIHDPLDDMESINMENVLRSDLKSAKTRSRRSSRFGGPGREGGGGGEEGGEGTRPNVGISIRALWEQMEELIDLLDQVNSVFGMTLQFLALEYLIFFPALLYFVIELYPELSYLSLAGFLVTCIILGIRSFVFTSVCARVHEESQAPINTLYRAYVKGDVSIQDYDIVNMFITRLSTTTIAVRTWSKFPITRQTFSIIFICVFGILALLLQSEHTNVALN